MTCKYCEGNLIEFNKNYACDKCGTLYKKENEEFINITCPKCGGELENGVCTYCTNEIVIKDEEEEEESKFEKKLDKLVKENSDIFEKRVGLGLMQGIVVKDVEFLAKIVAKALECGLLVLRSGKDTLRFLPPLNLSKKELKEGFIRLNLAINKAKK